MGKKVELSYQEFLEMKNAYLRDPDPLLPFGRSVARRFWINNDRLINHQGSVTEVRVLLDSLVDWIS